MHFVEDELDARDVGICLDFGHAHLDGDVVDAIETVSEHLSRRTCTTTAGASDDHLVPFDGTIDWPAALTAMQKVGYDGPLMFEIGARAASPKDDARAGAAGARRGCERL